MQPVQPYYILHKLLFFEKNAACTFVHPAQIIHIPGKDCQLAKNILFSYLFNVKFEKLPCKKHHIFHISALKGNIH